MFGEREALVFGKGKSARRTYGAREGEEESAGNADTASKTHGAGETALSDIGGRDALHQKQRSGDDGTESGSVQPVRGSGISDDALEVARFGALEESCVLVVAALTGHCR